MSDFYRTLIKPYYFNNPSTIKFKELTTTNQIGLLKKTSELIKQTIYLVVVVII